VAQLTAKLGLDGHLSQGLILPALSATHQDSHMSLTIPRNQGWRHRLKAASVKKFVTPHLLLTWGQETEHCTFHYYWPAYTV